MKVDQGEVIVCSLLSTLHTRVLNVEVLKSYIKNEADCDELCQQMAKVYIVRNGFERSILNSQDSSKSNLSVVFKRDVMTVLLSMFN